MTKQEYMNQLKNALMPYDDMIRSEILSDYEEHFSIGYSEGKTDDEIIASLGSIEELLEFLGQPKQQMPAASSIATSDSKTEKARNVILHGFTASVRVTKSADQTINADYINHGTQREQLLYTFTSQQEGDTLILKLEEREKWSNFFGRLHVHIPKMEIDLKVPDGFGSVTIQTLSGDMSIESIDVKQITAKTASGNISLRHAKAQTIESDSASGDISIHDICADIRMKTASGDISIDGHEGELISFTTASGDFDYRGSCLELDGTTASGDLDIELRRDAIIRCNSVSGDIKMKLPSQSKGITALQFKSLSGDLVSHHPSHQVKSNNYHYVTDKPGTKIILKTVSGDALIR